MKNLPTEHEICEAITQYLTLKTDLRDLFFHVPNGGRRRITEALRFKKIGVRAGVPDYVIPFKTCTCQCKCGGSAALFLEVKRGKQGKISEAQKDYMHKLQSQGYVTAVARSLEEAIAAIENYLKRHE